MNNTRPVGILRYNAEQMRDNGAPAEVIAKYLADNGSSIEQISAVPSPNPQELERLIASEKSGKFAEGAKVAQEAAEKSERSNKRLERLGTAQGLARGFGGGLLWNFADEAESALTGTPVAQIRAEQKAFEKEHPVLGVTSTIAGALANPTGAIGAAGKGATIGTKVARGALQGAGQGALYGLGGAEGGIENRLSDALSGAKTGAVIGGAVPIAVEGVKAAGRGLANVAGLTSGAGGESVKRAYEAGTRNSETFKTAMRGQGNVFNVVDEAEAAIKKLERDRTAAFKRSLPKNGKAIDVPTDAINKAYADSMSQITGVSRGVDDVAEKALKKVKRLAKNIDKAGGLNFENALEMKTAVDGIIQPLQRAGEKNAVRLLQPIQNALKESMESAVPKYKAARAGFAEASKTIDAIKSALSSGKAPTTELRALQGITRQSVAGAQGGKQQLGRILDEVSGGKILDEIAGGQVNSWVPRDILRALGAGGAAVSTTALNTNPLAIPALASFSPRAVGEIAFGLGRAASKTPTLTPSAITRIIESLRN